MTFRDFLRELWDFCGALVLLLIFLASMIGLLGFAQLLGIEP